MTVSTEVGDELLFERDGAVAWVTFNRPQARNAMTFAMYERLIEVCDEIDADRAIRCVVLTGAGGKAFVAGTDISQFRAFKGAEDALAYEQRIDRVLRRLEDVQVPTIAAIAGACTGGGAGIAATCDMRIATPKSRFGFPVARTLGNCLSINNLNRLVALVGPAVVKDMIFTARLVDAEEARSVGLFNDVVSDEDGLLPHVRDLAATIAGNAPLTLRATKEALRRIARNATPLDGSDLIALCYTSNDFREGIEAFFDKRPARWTGT